MSSTNELFHAAMLLTSDQRAQLAHQLLMSLEPVAGDADAEQAWTAEIRNRQQAIRAGQPIRDWDAAIADLRAALGQQSRE